MEDRPLAPVEGGEAGAGNLFDRGDVGVVPGAGVGGGSGARGRGGLGLGDSGGGAGWEVYDQGRGARAPAKAVAQAACRPVAIKSNRVIRIRPGVGVSKARSSSRPMSPSRDEWNRSRLSNRLDIRISTQRQSRRSDAGAFEPARQGSAADRHVGVDSRAVYAEPMTEPLREIGEIDWPGRGE